MLLDHNILFWILFWPPFGISAGSVSAVELALNRLND